MQRFDEWVSGEYPIKRGIDGACYRVRRNGKWENVSFTDLTRVEQEKIILAMPEDAKTGMILHLAATIRRIGDDLDLVVAD